MPAIGDPRRLRRRRTACTSCGSAIPDWDGSPRSVWMSLPEMNPGGLPWKRLLFGFLLLAVLVAAAADAQKTRDPGTSRRTAIVQAAERVGPSVVTISVVQTRMVQSSPFASDFFEPFFRDIPSYRYREQ